MNPSRWLWVVGIAGCLYLATTPRYYVGHFGDDARDILAARSLLHGRYASLQAPGQPALNFPLPGFPLFLSPFAAMAGPHVNALKVVPVFLTLLSLVLVMKLFSPAMSPGALLALMGLVAFNPVTLALSGTVIADSFYLVMTLSVFLVLRKQLAKETAEGAWSLGALVAWSGMIRPEGMLLLPAIALALGHARRWRLLMHSMILPLSIWTLWMIRNLALTGQTSGYTPLWTEALQFQAGGYSALWEHATTLAQKMFMELLLGVDLGQMTHWSGLFVAGACVMGLVLIFRGLVRSSEEARWPAPALFSLFLYCFSYIWLHLAWPAADAHYVWPLLPFLFYFILQGLLSFRKPKIVLVMTSLIAVLYLHQITAAVQDSLHPPVDQRLPQETMNWIREKTPANAFFLSPNAPVVTLYTQRYALALLGARNAKDFHDRLGQQGITHLLLTPTQFMFVKSAPGRDPQKLWERIQQTVMSSPGAYALLYQNPAESTSVYQVLPAKAGSL